MKTAGNNIKLGAMVIVTITALMAGLYLIGDKQNLFDDTFTVTTHFKDVSGLTEGNNVRFAGIDVGTVDDVQIISDTSVRVTMRIEEKYHAFITSKAIAMLGSDGVMGNRLVNISSSGEPGGVALKDGGIIASINAVSMDETTRTLSATNANLKEITDNIKNMTNKLDSSALWMVVQDTAVAQSLKATAYALSENMAAMQESFLLKGYFNRKEKEKEQAKEDRKEEKDKKKRDRKDND